MSVYIYSENFHDSALWFVVKLVINTNKSQEERVRSRRPMMKNKTDSQQWLLLFLRLLNLVILATDFLK